MRGFVFPRQRTETSIWAPALGPVGTALRIKHILHRSALCAAAGRGGDFNYFPLTGLRLIRTCGEQAGEEWHRLSTPPPIGPVDLYSTEVPPALPRLHLIE